MNINENEIAKLVQAVLDEMNGKPAATKKASGNIPSKAKVAMLTGLEKIDVK